jgi:hypothetical protein
MRSTVVKRLLAEPMPSEAPRIKNLSGLMA